MKNIPKKFREIDSFNFTSFLAWTFMLTFFQLFVYFILNIGIMMNGGGAGHKEEMLQTFQTKIGQNMDFDLPPYQEHDELAKTYQDEQFHEEVFMGILFTFFSCLFTILYYYYLGLFLSRG